jgi:tyrosine-protein kinase Etk/Wzc
MSLDENSRITNGLEGNSDSDDNFLDDFDFAKFLVVAKKSLVWVILLLLISSTASFLFNRYTKSVYRSSSILKLDVKSEAGALGLGDLREPFNSSKMSNIAGEIELIRSNLIYDKLIDLIDLNISYFQYGKILYEEKYKSSPFQVEYSIVNPAFYDKRFDVNILNDSEFILSYEMNGEEVSEKYFFGAMINSPDFNFKITTTSNYNPSYKDSYNFFTINSKGYLFNLLNNNLEVNILNLDANTIEIAFKDYDKGKARDIVSAICQIYLNETIENKSRAQEQTINFLNEMLENTEAKLVQSEVQLESFITKNKTVNVKENVSKIVGEIEELQKEKVELRSKLSLLNELKDLVSNDKEVKLFLPALSLFSDPQLATAITSLNALQQEREIALASSKENTFVMKSKNIAIDAIKANIGELITINKKIMLEQLAMLNNSIVGLEKTFLTLPSKETEYTRIKRFYDIYEKYYLLLMEKHAEFGIAKAGNVPNFVILSPASINHQPIYPNKILLYSAGLAIGLFLGIGLIVVRYLLHNTITTQKELESYVNAPILGGIPEYTKEKSVFSKLIVHKNPKSAISESIRSIRTNLDFIAPKSSEGKRIISITSTVSGEGKTFVSSNLSGIIAMSNFKVVLLDLDMRKPKVHFAFEGDNHKGMSTLLIGKHSLEECIKNTELENLDYISAGPVPPNPSELILRKEFVSLLDQLHKIYDVIIIDTPPVGLVTDGVLIMKYADIALYIVRANYTKKGVKKNINKLIASTGLRNLGIILNAMTNLNTYGYGAYGAYGTKGYGYYEEEYKDDKKSSLAKIKKMLS